MRLTVPINRVQNVSPHYTRLNVKVSWWHRQHKSYLISLFSLLVVPLINPPRTLLGSLYLSTETGFTNDISTSVHQSQTYIKTLFWLYKNLRVRVNNYKYIQPCLNTNRDITVRKRKRKVEPFSFPTLRHPWPYFRSNTNTFHASYIYNLFYGQFHVLFF